MARNHELWDWATGNKLEEILEEDAVGDNTEEFSSLISYLDAVSEGESTNAGVCSWAGVKATRHLGPAPSFA